MIDRKYIAQFLQRNPIAGTIVYLVVLLGIILTCWLSIANLLDRHATLIAEREILAQLQAHRKIVPKGNSDGVSRGSPFLQGQTITIAGANLLERVSSAITRVGGRVLSSQVDLQAGRLKPGFVGVGINCELDQPSLQKLLYDLEAGTPFLFIEHLEVRSREAAADEEDAHMQVIITASGQWAGQL